MAKILLVEDNEMNADMLQRRLVHRGHEVLVATSGTEGIDLAGSETPDIILMDLSLPGIDGLEAARSLKQEPATRGIPIVALTAHAMEEDRTRSLEAGCDDYDTKPVDIQRLLGKIERLLGGE